MKKQVWVATTVIIVAMIALTAIFVLKKTYFGRYIYMQ